VIRICFWARALHEPAPARRSPAKALNQPEASLGSPGVSSQDPIGADQGGGGNDQRWAAHGIGASLDARLLSKPEGAPRRAPRPRPEWHCSLCCDDPLQRKRQRVPRRGAVRMRGPEPQVGQDLLDVLWLLDEGDAPHGAAALRAQQVVGLVTLLLKCAHRCMRACEIAEGGTSIGASRARLDPLCGLSLTDVAAYCTLFLYR